MSDTVRHRPTEMLLELNALVNERIDLARRGPDRLPAVPWMDNGMDNSGHDLDRIAPDQVFRAPGRIRTSADSV